MPANTWNLRFGLRYLWKLVVGRVRSCIRCFFRLWFPCSRHVGRAACPRGPGSFHALFHCLPWVGIPSGFLPVVPLRSAA